MPVAARMYNSSSKSSSSQNDSPRLLGSMDLHSASADSSDKLLPDDGKCVILSSLKQLKQSFIHLLI